MKQMVDFQTIDPQKVLLQIYELHKTKRIDKEIILNAMSEYVKEAFNEEQLRDQLVYYYCL